MAAQASPTPIIGSLNEKPLHAALKAWYAAADARLEVRVDGYVVDLVQGGGLVEIQTGNFGAMRTKLDRLLANHPVLLVYPVAQEKWILRVSEDGEILSRRKSPKRGRVEELCAQLVSLPRLLHHPNLTVEVVLIRAEEIWRRGTGGQGWRRTGWVVHERRLVEVVSRRRFSSSQELADLMPPTLPTCFTTATLAQEAGVPRRLAQQMVYCLRELGEVVAVGMEGRSRVYRRRKQ